jgi:hypothetical protein
MPSHFRVKSNFIHGLTMMLHLQNHRRKVVETIEADTFKIFPRKEREKRRKGLASSARNVQY